MPSPINGTGFSLGNVNASAGSNCELELLLAAVERKLDALGEALRKRDARAIDAESTCLHQALVRALDGFSVAAREGRVPQDLRTRLARASGQVVVHRECLARATAALDRAVDALMPRDPCVVYAAKGNSLVFASSPGASRA